jgi:hypothetical protein
VILPPTIETEVGEELRPLHHERLDLVPVDPVHVRIVDRDLGRAEDCNLVDRNHDVAVARSMAAIDHRIGHALVEDQHRALAGRHRKPGPGQRCDPAGPRAGGGDHEPRRDSRHRTRSLVR